MAVYDIFLDNPHPLFFKKLLVNNASRLINYTFNKFNLPTDGTANVLEIGPGKGYFYEAFKNLKYGKYYAMDRNNKILENLHIEEKNRIFGALPKIPINLKFDLIFCGYVIEHLEDGIHLYNSLCSLKEHLNDNGVLIIQFPNCMKLGMEFYNIDYTHCLPTTKRNVNQAVIDSGMCVIKCVDLSGIIYTRIVDSNILYYIRKFFCFFYSYKICDFIFKWLYRVPLWDLKNVFWRGYALIKEPNVMFFCKKS